MGLWTVSGHRTSLGSQRLFPEAEQCPESCQGITGCSTAPGSGSLLHCFTRPAAVESPGPLLLPAPYLSAAEGSCTDCSCVAAQRGSLEAAQSPAPSSSTFLPPPRLVQQQLPAGGRGWEGSRSDGACRVLGHGPGHVHQPSGPGGFKPLPVPREVTPTLPIHAMRLLLLLLLLGLCCLWARLVSPGECGWAQVGTGEHRWMWEPVEQCCRRMCGHCAHGWECSIPPVLSPLHLCMMQK